MAFTKFSAGIEAGRNMAGCLSIMDLTLREVAFRLAFVSLSLILTAINLL